MKVTKRVFKIVCECDVGQDQYIFATVAIAREWLHASESFQEWLDDIDNTVEGCIKDGLLGFQELYLVE